MNDHPHSWSDMFTPGDYHLTLHEIHKFASHQSAHISGDKLWRLGSPSGKMAAFCVTCTHVTCVMNLTMHAHVLKRSFHDVHVMYVTVTIY